MNKKKKIIVLGGGVTGLMLTKILSDNNCDVSLIIDEKSVDYRQFEKFRPLNIFGYNSLFLKNEKNINFVKKHLGLTIEKQPQKKHVLIDGAVYSYPLKIFDVFKNTGLRFMITVFIDYIHYHFKFKEVKTYKDYVLKCFGKKLYDYYFVKYLENEFVNFPLDNLDIQLAKNRIHYISLKKMFHNLIKNKVDNKYTSDYYHYPANGYCAFMRRLENCIVEKGGVLISNVKLKKINKSKNEIIVNYTDNKGSHEISAQKVFSTISITKLYNLIHSGAEINLNWSSEYIVNIKFVHFNKKFPDGLFYTADKQLSFFQLNKISNTEGLKENECLCSLTLSVKRILKENIVDKIIGELKSINLLNELSVAVGSLIIEKKEEKPILHNGFKDEYAKMHRSVARFGGITCFGERANFSEFSFEKNIKDIHERLLTEFTI